MRAHVGEVLKLVGKHAPWALGGRTAPRDVDRVVRVRDADGAQPPHLGAERLQGLRLLRRRVVGQRDEAAAAERARDEREADAGAAGGALGDEAAGRAQAARGERLSRDLERDAVLDAAARVEELGLGEDLFLRCGVCVGGWR